MRLKQAVKPSPEEKKRIVQNIRYERYKIQSAARDLFVFEGMKKNLEYPQNFHSTAKCTHTVFSQSVSVFHSKKYDKAFYGGLVTCGNVWTCPVCAAKVEEKRRIEIAKAFDWAYSNNKKVVMVTFTAPHSMKQSLKELLTMQATAFKSLRGGKVFDKLKNRIGFKGLIRSLEVTFGANGWHPHTHEAWIVDEGVNTDELRAVLARRWFKFCSKVGLVPDKRKTISFLEHSVKITDWCKTSEYLAKQDDSKHWGADRELAKASTKEGRSKGYHPFGLLAEFSEDNSRRFLADKFLEYARDIKGKRRIYWSPGLKELVNVIEKTDLELAEEKTEHSDLLKLLSREQWKIIRTKKLKTRLLDCAEDGNLDEFLQSVFDYKFIPVWDHKDFIKRKEIDHKNAIYCDEEGEILDFKFCFSDTLKDKEESYEACI